MNLITDFISSITNTSSYALLAQKKLKASLGYFLFWTLILSLCSTLYLCFKYLPHLNQSLRLTHDQLQSLLPSDFVLTLSPQSLSFTPPTDVLVTNPSPNPLVDTPYLLVLTNATNSAQIIDAALALTPTHLHLRFKPLANPLTLPYSDLNQNLVLSKTDLLLGINELQALFKPLAWLPFVVFTLTLWLEFSLLNLMLLAAYLGIYAFINLILPSPFSFKSLTSLSLHTNILAQSLTLLTTALYGTLISGFTSWAFLAITSLALYSIRKTKIV